MAGEHVVVPGGDRYDPASLAAKADVVPDLSTGVERARQLLTEGAARAVRDRWIEASRAAEVRAAAVRDD
jgi:hypothetical protein